MSHAHGNVLYQPTADAGVAVTGRGRAWSIGFCVAAFVLHLILLPRTAFGQVDVGHSWTDCAFHPPTDADADGFDDSCEYDIAHAFRPQLMMSAGDMATTRVSHWAVRPMPEVGPGISRIFYALAYLNDTGVPWLPPCRGAAHYGDSEFIVLDVEWVAANNWRLRRAFLSAHYMSPLDRSTWHDYSELTYPLADPLADRGRPNVYVSQGKHANFVSLSTCGAGIVPLDICAGDAPQDVQVDPSRNLGSLSNSLINRLSATVSGSACASSADTCHHESFWGISIAERFCGWQVDDTFDRSSGCTFAAGDVLGCCPTLNDYGFELTELGMAYTPNLAAVCSACTSHDRCVLGTCVPCGQVNEPCCASSGSARSARGNSTTNNAKRLPRCGRRRDKPELTTG